MGARGRESRRRKPVQQELRLERKSRRGGRRPGAGRPRKRPCLWGKGPGVRHEKRPELHRRHPLHVTIRLAPRVWNLRSRRSFKAIEKALFAVRFAGARLTHFSIQGNHVHLIVETESRLHLGRAMRGLNVRMAKALNRLMGTSGQVLADRYHETILRTPTQVKRAIHYVLANTRKHQMERGVRLGPVTRDDYAAGPAEHVPPTMELRPSPLVLDPRTWLLQEGWRRAA